jgi:hypothetical protein
MFSDVTSVIMATIVDDAQRILMKRPTVPRTSEMGIWPSARTPTRANEPRTEITRPKDVTGSNLVCYEIYSGPTIGRVLAQTVKPPKPPVRQICSILAHLPQRAGSEPLRTPAKTGI